MLVWIVLLSFAAALALPGGSGEKRALEEFCNLECIEKKILDRSVCC
ncbi:MAG: hypothetical protein ABFC73_03340 [Clostridiaceae bacterium]